MSSKPLSEQVAELEQKLNTERAGMSEVVELLRDMNERLRTERDRLKADAMSDLTQRHWLETQVRNREAERDELTRKNTLASWKVENLKFELDKVSGERKDLRAERDDLQRQVQEARDERDELRSGQGLWPSSAEVPQSHTRTDTDGIKDIFTAVLKAKKAEDESSRRVQDAWRSVYAEVCFGQDDDVTTPEATDE